MSTHDSFMNLWNYMEVSEKQRLMRQFLEQHGDHFSRKEFLRFLAGKYDVVPLDYNQNHRNLKKERHPL